MAELLDIDGVQRVLVASFTGAVETVAAALPRIVAALLIALVGWAVARIAERISARALRRLGLDRLAARLELGRTLSRGGFAARPSAIAGRAIFWALFLLVVLSAVDTLGVAAARTAVDRVVAFLPRVVAALVIVVAGIQLGRLARGVVGSAAAAASLTSPERLGIISQGAVVLLVAVFAVEQLGVEAQVLIAILTVVVLVSGLTVGVTFALGARQVVGHILAGHYLRQRLPAETVIEIGDRRGTLARVGPVATVFRDGEQSFSVPNGRLLEETVVH